MAGERTSFSDLKRRAIENYEREFRELSDTWRNLDTKAQGLGALAGIFLAAAFAWTDDIAITFSKCERWIFFAAIVSLVITVGAALVALWIRRPPVAPFGQTAEWIDQIVQRGKQSELREVVEALSNQQMGLWKQVNDEMREKHNATKAIAITCGQAALVIAAILVALLAVGRMDIL